MARAQRIQIGMSEWHIERLDDLAKRERRSISNLARALLETAIEEATGEHPDNG